jgi:hypothetical protein
MHGHRFRGDRHRRRLGAEIGALAGGHHGRGGGPDARHRVHADAPGDWAFHCHKSHHTMNAMGHDVPTMIGVDQRDITERISKLVPDYMEMGSKGMAEMGEMEMPLPDNTLPMMTGWGRSARWRWAACSRW